MLMADNCYWVGEVGCIQTCVDGYSPPVVDAGQNRVEFSFTFDMAGVVTPGSDPNPVILWTLASGQPHTFVNDSDPTTSFTQTGDLYTTLNFQLTVTPNDGPAVIDTMLVEIIT